MMIKHYVEYFYPGMMFPETTAIETQSRDLDKAKLPDNAYAMRFYDTETIESESGRSLESKPFNYSGMMYEGELYTIEDVAEKVPNSLILQSNMRSNNWPVVVRTKKGNFQPFNEGDVLLNEKSTVSDVIDKMRNDLEEIR